MKDLMRRALKEDLGQGDITSQAFIPKQLKAQAHILAKESGVLAGTGPAREIFRLLKVNFKPLKKDGSPIKKGQVLAKLSGPARGILTGERTALNFLQHLSGIATQTKKYKGKLKGARAILLDTRKTVPGLRLLEKQAVKAGGGTNHRMGLYDAVLIKNNHLKLLGGMGRTLRQLKHKRAAEIEARTIEQVKAAAAARVGRILLDNMSLKNFRRSVKICRKFGVRCEASGGVNLKNIRAIAKTGVNYISVGALTHSAPALDISLKII